MRKHGRCARYVILDGRQPPGLTLSALMAIELPADWTDQARAIQRAADGERRVAAPRRPPGAPQPSLLSAMNLPVLRIRPPVSRHLAPCFVY